MSVSGITESVKQDSAQFHEALFEYNPCHTIVVDTEGKIITYNRAKRESGDRLPEEGDILFKDYVGRHDGEMYSELMNCISSGKTKQFPSQSYLERFFSITISPFPGGAIVISEDVTEQKKSEIELRKSEEFNRAMFDYNPCQTIVVDTEGKIITYNKAKRESGDRLPGENDIIFKDYAGRYEDDMYSELLKCIKEGQTRRFPDRKYVDKYLTTTISPFPGGATIITEDVSKRVEAEKELAQANEELKEKDKLKTAFVSSISHELRTSLCIFNNAVSNMNAGAMGKVSKKLKDTFEMASGSVDRLAKVIDEFIELSEIELGKAQLTPEEVDMRAICEDVIKWVNPQLKESKLKLKSVMPDMASLITLDPAGITKVLHHLLGNAIKFSPKGTTIELQLEDRGRDIALYVKDQGPGIEAENVEKIFDCFAKFDPNNCPGKTGLGIGLTLAKGIVEMHNGEIIAASTPGKQTTFRVSIPK